MPCACASCERLVDRALDARARKLEALRNRIGHDDPAGQAYRPLRPHDARNVCGRIRPRIDAETAVAAPECGQAVGAEPDDRHAVRLQVFEGEAQVEHGLGARAHHGHGRARQLLQVRGNVEARRGAPMHAADAAGGENGNAGECCDDHRRSNGRSAGAAARNDDGQVAAAYFGDVRPVARKTLDRVVRETGLQAVLRRPRSSRGHSLRCARPLRARARCRSCAATACRG